MPANCRRSDCYRGPATSMQCSPRLSTSRVHRIHAHFVERVSVASRPSSAVRPIVATPNCSGRPQTTFRISADRRERRTLRDCSTAFAAAWPHRRQHSAKNRRNLAYFRGPVRRGAGTLEAFHAGVASRIHGRLSMGNRIFVAVVLLLWASTMSWLVVEKILPPFFSGEPPTHGVAAGKTAGLLGNRMCGPARRLRGPPGGARCPIVDGNPQPGAARRTSRSRKWPRSG